MFQNLDCGPIGNAIAMWFLAMVVLTGTQCLCFERKKISHYENLPMQYKETFNVVKIENFH